MNKPIKTKLCWNCEGNVSRTAENCPYCAVYLNPDTDDLNEEITNAPYSAEKHTHDIPKAPYSPSEEEAAEEAPRNEAVLSKSQTNFQALFLPLTLLTTGLVALFFSLMLFLFSENGKLTLQWNGDTWYFYAFLALPLLFFGWRYLDQE